MNEQNITTSSGMQNVAELLYLAALRSGSERFTQALRIPVQPRLRAD